jgi:hypothetical protein
MDISGNGQVNRSLQVVHVNPIACSGLGRFDAMRGTVN